MKSLWHDADASALPDFEGLLYASRLVGADPNLVLWGGGNTSAKLAERDFRGREVRVLRVKGSGSDLKTIQPKDFPGARLDDVLPLQEREAMSDEEMVDYLAHTLQEPSSPRPSIETLLHAFVPARFVVHTHADAILALTNTPHGQQWVREALGPGALWVEYRRPGFDLSKRVAEAVTAHPDATCVVMEKHGLITWGDTAREAYERTIATVTRAEGFATERTSPPGPLAREERGNAMRQAGGVSPSPMGRGVAEGRGEVLDAAARRRVFVAIAPLIRSLAARTTAGGDVAPTIGPNVSPPATRVVLRFDDSPDVLAFASDPEAARLSQIGPATPDHLINTKRTPLYVPVSPTGTANQVSSTIVEALEPAWTAWAREYARYVQRGSPNTPAPAPTQVDLRPRVILVPGVGMITLGRDARAARIAGEIYHHAVATIRDAEAIEAYASLDAQDCYDVEYWPLELYKLTLAPPERPLARRVAAITGAASGIGRAIAERLAADGAHVVILDKNGEGARATAEAIAAANGADMALAVETDVSDEASVARAFEETVLAYGGVDIVVSNAGLSRSHPVEETSLAEWQLLQDVLATGYFLVAREAFRLWKRQGIGGSLIFVASKNSLVAGKDNVAYSAAKAAELHLARCLAEEGGAAGIRVNTVCPDAVLQGSGIWTSAWREERARTYGIHPDELEEFYRKRTTLKVNVFPQDIAEAVHFFASDRSAKTTGGVLTVDGGVAAAYVR